ncbi:MAG TPA: RDD family protein [Flavobacteriales bacterium]|jgi:uncharacterized RDD family membrane protein YckC|nr:RDD family protein [Flavobacteriales bacterium]
MPIFEPVKELSITTAQHVVIDYQLASLRDRILAYILDYILLNIISVGALFIMLALSSSLQDEFYFLVFVPAYLFYALLFEILNKGQTPGKIALGTRVVRTSGEVPSISDYVLRWIFRPLDIYVSLGSLAVVLIASSDKNQRLGDRMANTTVIKAKADVRFTLSDIEKLIAPDYEVQYPNVKLLSEDDALVVKAVLERNRKNPGRASRMRLSELTDKLKIALEIDDKSPDDQILKSILKDYVALTR